MDHQNRFHVPHTNAHINSSDNNPLISPLISVQVPSIFIPKHTVETYPYRHKRFHSYYDFPEQGIRR